MKMKDWIFGGQTQKEQKTNKPDQIKQITGGFNSYTVDRVTPEPWQRGPDSLAPLSAANTSPTSLRSAPGPAGVVYSFWDSLMNEYLREWINPPPPCSPLALPSGTAVAKAPRGEFSK